MRNGVACRDRACLSLATTWLVTFDRKSNQNSPLKTFPSESSRARFGRTVVHPIAIAKTFDAAFLGGCGFGWGCFWGVCPFLLGGSW